MTMKGQKQANGRNYPSTETRLLAQRVINGAGCWIFCGARDGCGYGMLRHQGKVLRAHIVAYKIWKGEPTGIVCHSCNEPACFNPEHLYDGTKKTNYEDAVKAGTHFNTQVVDRPFYGNQWTGSLNLVKDED